MSEQISSATGANKRKTLVQLIQASRVGVHAITKLFLSISFIEKFRYKLFSECLREIPSRNFSISSTSCQMRCWNLDFQKSFWNLPVWFSRDRHSNRNTSRPELAFSIFSSFFWLHPIRCRLFNQWSDISFSSSFLRYLTLLVSSNKDSICCERRTRAMRSWLSNWSRLRNPKGAPVATLRHLHLSLSGVTEHAFLSLTYNRSLVYRCSRSLLDTQLTYFYIIKGLLYWAYP